ncbi:invasin domain 3-containing protein, partial [Ignatzschineria sp. LJL83]
MNLSYGAIVPTGTHITWTGSGTAPNFSCNTLYGSGSGTRPIFTADHTWQGGGDIPTQAIYTLAGSTTGGYAGTIALGPAGSADGKMTMFSWRWNRSDPTVAVQEGDTQVYKLNPDPPTGSGWSGGEVNQLTGEIIFSAYEGRDNDYRREILMRYNPVTGAYVANTSAIPAATPADAVSLRLASDMALDANGNAYLLAGRGTDKVLLRYDISDSNSANWRYTKVLDFPRGAADFTGSIWGMAFLDGKLYASVNSSTHTLYEINLLKQQTREVGNLRNDTRDLASCQVAPVIEGTLYQDAQGLGNITPSSAAPLVGQHIEIWKEEGGIPVYQSTVLTNGIGGFSFLLDSTNATYYIRSYAPKIGDKFAAQTWVSSSAAGGNSVTNYCYNPATKMMDPTPNGSCASRPTDGAAGASSNMSQWSSFTKVTIATDKDVPKIEMAFSAASNYADAPASYNNGSVGPSHVSLGVSGNTVTNHQLNSVHLGKTVSTAQGNMPSDSADNIPTHDGVEVAIAGSTNFRSLQDFVFVTGEMYDIRINVEGAEAERAYLSAWLAMSGGARTNNFENGTVLLTDRQLADGGNGGYVIIRYQATQGVATTTASYARFRVSSVQGLTPTESSTAGRIIDGEVEDYRVYFVPGEVSIATKTLGGTGSFSYNFSNILSTYPSTTSSTIDVLTEDTEYYDSSHHVFNLLNNAVVITQTSPATNWTLIEASCQVGQQTINDLEFTDEGRITIPARYIVGGSQISCVLTNSLGPRLELIKSITDRDHADDQFIVQIKDNASASVVHAAETVGGSTTATTGKVTLAEQRTFTLTEIMANGDNDRLKRYDSAISCINNTTSSGTVLPTGIGQAFEITPVNGDDITCTITNTPIKISTEHSKITAEPSIIIADGETTSTVTVQLYKDNGDQVTVGGDADRITIFFIDNNHIGEIVDEAAGVVDNGDGSYSVKVRSSDIAENEEIGYRIDGNIGQNTATVSYIFGEPSTEHSTIEVDKPSIEANGEEKATLTVRLFDENRNPITSSTDSDGNAYDIQIVYVDENNKIDESVLSTTTHSNNDGSFVATVSSVKAGLDKFTFKIRGEVSPKSVDVTYMAGAPSVVKSSITANPVSILADGIDKSTFQVQLYDMQGNIITSNINPSTQEPYNIKVVYADAINKVGEDISETTYLANGVFTATVVSKASGKDTFTFEIEGSKPDAGNTNGTVVVAYGAGAADTNSSQITISPKEIKADGVDSAVITVTLFDRNNNQLTSGSDVDGNEYEVVVYSMLNEGNLGNLAVEDGKAQNNQDGTFTISVTSTTKGREDFSFKVNGVASNSTDYVNYLVGELDLGTSTIVAKPNRIDADGRASSVIIVQLKDANGNELESNPGTVNILGVTLALQAQGTDKIPASYSGEGGRYTVDLTSIKAGVDDNIHFELEGFGEGAKDNPASLTYLAGAVDSGKSLIRVDRSPIVADLQDSATVTIYLKDANENDISAEDAEALTGNIELYFNEGNGPVGIPSELRHIAGTSTYQATMTSKVANKADNISFTLNGRPSAALPAYLEYVAGAVSSLTSTISAIPLEIDADGQSKSEITVQLRDQFENDVVAPDRIYDVQLTFSADKKGTLEPNNTTGAMSPAGSGRYVANVFSTIQGEDTFGFNIVSIGDGGPDNTVTINYKIGGISATRSEIWVEPKEISTNEGEIATVYVQLMDAQGNKPSEHEYNVFIRELEIGKTVMGSDQFIYISEGLYSLDIYSETAGSETLKFSYSAIEGGSLINASNTDVVTYIAGDIDMTTSSITINPNTIAANDTARANVVVQLRDKFNNPIQQNLGIVTIIDLEKGYLNNEDNTLTYQENSGTYRGFIKSTVAGSDEAVRFTLGTSTTPSTQSASVSYTAGNYNLESSIITVDKPIITADEVDKAVITIQFRDIFGNNLDQEVEGEIRLAGVNLGQRITNPALYKGEGRYEIEIISRQIGKDTISASLNNDPIANNTSVEITYIAGEATAENSIITAHPPVIEANGEESSILRVQLRDQFGNNLERDEAYSVTLDETTLTTGRLVVGSTGNFESVGNGRYELAIQSDAVGFDDVNFKLEGILSTTGAVHVKYEQGSVSLVSSTLTLKPDTIVADGVDRSTVTVQLKDSSGHDVDDGARIITLVGGEGTVGTLPTTALTHEGSGRYVGYVTSLKSGVDTIGYRIQDLGDGSDTKLLTYIAGNYSLVESLIKVEPATIKADGIEEAVVTIQLRDENKNPLLTDTAIVELLPLEKGTLKDSSNGYVLHSLGNGLYSGTIVSIISGPEIVGFKIDGNAANNTHAITYTAGDADLTKSEITAIPAQIEANGRDQSIVSIQLKDRYGNNVERDSGEVILTNYRPGIPNDTASGVGRPQLSYQGNGRYEGFIISTEAGQSNVSFTLDGNRVPADIYAPISYVAGGADTKYSVISASPVTITADGVDRSKVTVQLRDGEGNSVSDINNPETGMPYQVVLKLEGGGSFVGDVENVTMIPATDGQFFTYVTSTLAGSDTFTFEIDNRPASSSATVTYTAGKADASTSIIRSMPDSIEVSAGEITSTLTVE